MIGNLDNRAGGVALMLGYVLLVAALFRDPSNVSAATATVQGIAFFLVFPALGFASGLYAYLGGPFHAAGVVVAATYLGAVGVSLALLLSGLPGAFTLLGIGLFALAVVALVGTLRSAIAALGLGDVSI